MQTCSEVDFILRQLLFVYHSTPVQQCCHRATRLHLVPRACQPSGQGSGYETSNMADESWEKHSLENHCKSLLARLNTQCKVKGELCDITVYAQGKRFLLTRLWLKRAPSSLPPCGGTAFPKGSKVLLSLRTSRKTSWRSLLTAWESVTLAKVQLFRWFLWKCCCVCRYYYYYYYY